MKAAVRPVSRRVWTSSLRNVCSHPFGDRNIGVLRKAATWTGIARGHPHLEVVMPFRPVEGDQQPSARPQEPERFIDPGVPQEPVEPIQGTAPLNPQPGGATRPEPPRPRPPSPGRGSSAGSGERGLTNSSTWGIVPWGPWVSCGGWGYNSHRRRPACTLPTPKVISGQAVGRLDKVRGEGGG
jgi:hypothetical protein